MRRLICTFVVCIWQKTHFSHDLAHLKKTLSTCISSVKVGCQMSHLLTKPTKWHVHPAKTQISLGIHPVWSESLLCTQWVAKDSSFLHADSEDWSDWADASSWSESSLGAHAILLVLSWGGKIIICDSSYFTLFIPRHTKSGGVLCYTLRTLSVRLSVHPSALCFCALTLVPFDLFSSNFA